MTWIASVAPYDTAQSLWANNMRDRVVQTFTDLAEANAHVASLPVGAVCHIEGSGYLYRKDGSGQWRPLFNLIVAATMNPQSSIDAGATYACFNANIPAGFRSALIEWDQTTYTAKLDYAAELRLYVAGTAVAASRHGQQIARIADAYADYQTMHLSGYWTLDPNVITAVQGDLTNQGTGGMVGPITHHADPLYTRMTILAIP